ncbi:unnamed protein product, partial [Rotaria socialis]
SVYRGIDRGTKIFAACWPLAARIIVNSFNRRLNELTSLAYNIIKLEFGDLDSLYNEGGDG